MIMLHIETDEKGNGKTRINFEAPLYHDQVYIWVKEIDSADF